MRQKLEIGQQITLICDGTEKQFTIKKLIGDGATCIAYEASRINSNGMTEHYRIKECYPYDADISRNELELIWADEAEKQKYFERFKSSYQITNQLKYEETIGNNITNAMLCEGNGTVYSVMEINHANVYSNIKETSLEKILDTILVLTKVVGNLHKNGYLHLDIKPDNFLVSYEPNTNIWLFDVDSLTSIAELKAGSIKSTPYSFSYAAPEQKFNEISKINFATDIFAIGAVLFERIMHTCISVDDMSVFADWNLDNNSLFDDINPKIKRLIKNIFRKTLAVSPKRRYKTTDELVAAIELALKTVQEKLFIVSNIPANAAHFIGRETEIAAIHNEFKSDQKAVFIHGFGGMGKSSLAIAYANKHKNNYDTAVFLKYRDSLKELLCEINIQNYEEADADKLKVLPKLLDKNCLLIIDNFDIEIDRDEYLDELLQLNTNILFTTRTDFSSVYGEDTTQIEVSQLADKELLQLFRNISGDNHSTDEIISKLLLLVEGHTYAVELLALQIAASGCTIEELHNKVSNGLDELTDYEKVRTRKDGHIIKRTIPEIIRALFNVAKLNEERKQVLRNLYLLKFLYVDKDTYRKYTKATTTEINALNDLTESGWVRTTNNHWYSLHPLVEELVSNDLHPSMENCESIYNYIQHEIRMCECFDIYSELDEHSYNNSISFLCTFFNNIDLHEKNNRNILINWLLQTIRDYDDENSELCIGRSEDSVYTPLYRKIELLTQTIDLEPIEKFNIYYILLYSWLLEFQITYLDIEQRNHLNELRENKLKKYFNLSISVIQQCDNSITEELLDKVYSSILFIAGSMIMPSFPKEFIVYLYLERPHTWQLGLIAKNRLGLPLSVEEQKEIDDVNANLPDVFKDGYTVEDIEAEQEFKSAFLMSKDKVQFVRELSEDSECAPVTRASLIGDCKEAFFGDFQFYRWFLSFSDEDWKTIQDILNIEESLLFSDTYEQSEFYNIHDHNDLISQNSVEQCVVSVMRQQYDIFENIINNILIYIKIELTDYVNADWHWSRIIDLNNWQRIHYRLIRSFININKASFILPYILKINSGFYEYAKLQSDFDEKLFFNNYKLISELAQSAYFEKNVPEKYKLEYMDIEVEYERKMDELSGKNFILKV